MAAESPKKQTQFKPNTNPIKPNLLDAQMNVSAVLTKDYDNEQRTMNNERLCKTNPIQTQYKAEANLSLRERRSLRVSFSESSNRGPISKAKKMLLHLTINGRRKSFGYYADEIEAARAYDNAARKYHAEFACLNFPDAK